MEPLQHVFGKTLKCHYQSTTAISLRDVSVALESLVGVHNVEGLNITLRKVELTVFSRDTYNTILQNPLLINPDLRLQFEPAYTDNFVITMYNVPLGSTGMRETAIIEDAGAKVLQHEIVTKPSGFNSSFKTGERRFLCTNRSTFSYLPTVVTSYAGRKMGCRYRGQAHDLATKVSSSTDPPTALAASSIWADPHLPDRSLAVSTSPSSPAVPLPTSALPSMGSQPVVSAPQVSLPSPLSSTFPSGSLHLVAVPPSAASSVRSSLPAHTSLTSSSGSSRPLSSSRVSSPEPIRERSPLKEETTRRHPVTKPEADEDDAMMIQNFGKTCAHTCPHCPEVFTHSQMYDAHEYQYHSVAQAEIKHSWDDVAESNPIRFREEFKKVQCDVCGHYFQTHPLIL